MRSALYNFLTLSLIFYSALINAQENTGTTFSGREHILMDMGWRFALGSANNSEKDFYSGTSYFTYYAKTGYGDGPAAAGFEDRTWRQVDLPHDWAVELPFSAYASHSHGYRTIGWKYPDTSVGWYRKKFFIPQKDLGRKISIQFDGVFRNSIVWVNGFYLGQEHSGYATFEYDITDYLNYGGDNVVCVRADASTEEGWFYEGAGIYRHTWLNKTRRLHVSENGTFITSELNHGGADITIRTTVQNEDNKSAGFTIEQTLLDSDGHAVGKDSTVSSNLNTFTSHTYLSKIKLGKPHLWSPDDPYLYKLETKIVSAGEVMDLYQTNVGIRTVLFDAGKGFFLNGLPLKIKGTNNHQDHAGVGTAIPDALWEFRVKKLKEMGSNAIRTSHNPASPALLDVCDRLGMLVLEENRLQGINEEHFDLLKRMIIRDRNHPCIIAWSLGNEEWAIEGNILGERITSTMKTFAHTLDSTHLFTVAISGGCGNGTSKALDVMGFNYLAQCDIDDYHKKNPYQPAMGTEENTTSGTRGIYENDLSAGHMAPDDRTGAGPSIERGWKFYYDRPFLSGLFFWTGFDYKGEPNPLSWPAVSSQYGIYDACGFPKDQFYYLKSWWTNEPVLHITPHWNWKGMEGQVINVWTYSNCDAVELFLNRKSLGKKLVTKNSHTEWKVRFEPGTLFAKGYKNGKEIITDKVETSGDPASLQLVASGNKINADGEDVTVIAVKVADSKGRPVPMASNEITFSLSGPAKIIGVGNGDPGSHEPDKFIEKITTVKIANLQMKKVEKGKLQSLINDKDDSNWPLPFAQQKNFNEKDIDSLKLNAIRGEFTLDNFTDSTEVTLYPKSICEVQSVYINGNQVLNEFKNGDRSPECILPHSLIKPGKNTFLVTGTPLKMKYQWDNLNTDPGLIKVVNPAGQWKRKLFNGYAQVIIQSMQQPGEVYITATSPGLNPANFVLKTDQVILPKVNLPK